MTVETLIEKLSKYPPHFEVQIFKDGMAECDDYTAEILDVVHFQPEKIVSIEVDTDLMSDGTGLKKRWPVKDKPKKTE